ncbi:hypothetical protein BJ508DRAFT_315660 [Ascobolus immersus RN42]|uniref:Uncharacterized protein n=1 Tax=Ascobolus immersus RN42 TaxID=1160509 RepID=A0A3N4HH38_ASCIM|nr:hypothetical protein BJ508DRAFT_315660 [Ascobolus immersus RN42]
MFQRNLKQFLLLTVPSLLLDDPSFHPDLTFVTAPRLGSSSNRQALKPPPRFGFPTTITPPTVLPTASIMPPVTSLTDLPASLQEQLLAFVSNPNAAVTSTNTYTNLGSWAREALKPEVLGVLWPDHPGDLSQNYITYNSMLIFRDYDTFAPKIDRIIEICKSSAEAAKMIEIYLRGIAHDYWLYQVSAADKLLAKAGDDNCAKWKALLQSRFGVDATEAETKLATTVFCLKEIDAGQSLLQFFSNRYHLFRQTGVIDDHKAIKLVWNWILPPIRQSVGAPTETETQAAFIERLKQCEDTWKLSRRKPVRPTYPSYGSPASTNPFRSGLRQPYELPLVPAVRDFSGGYQRAYRPPMGPYGRGGFQPRGGYGGQSGSGFISRTPYAQSFPSNNSFQQPYYRPNTNQYSQTRSPFTNNRAITAHPTNTTTTTSITNKPTTTTKGTPANTTNTSSAPRPSYPPERPPPLNPRHGYFTESEIVYFRRPTLQNLTMPSIHSQRTWLRNSFRRNQRLWDHQSEDPYYTYY